MDSCHLFPEIYLSPVHRTDLGTSCQISGKNIRESLPKLSYAAITSPDTFKDQLNPKVTSQVTDLGGFFAVKISQQAYENRLKACEHSIIGRVTLGKGEVPIRQCDLKLKLNSLWSLQMNWKLISIGKGFYHMIFETEEALQNIWSRGAIHLNPGILRLLPWSPGFDPAAHKSSTAQVWVRMHNLPYEFWDKQIISDIARGIGLPLKIDKNTLDGEFGHFARVLVDIDLKKPIQQTLRVDTDNTKIWINLEYEGLPDLCSTCHAIGHSSVNCRRNFPREQATKQRQDISREPNERKNDLREPSRGRSKNRKFWKQKSSKSVSEVPVKGIFERCNNDINDKGHANTTSNLPKPQGTSATVVTQEVMNTNTEEVSLEDTPSCSHIGMEIVIYRPIAEILNQKKLSLESTSLSMLSPLMLNGENDQINKDQTNEDDNWTVVSKKKKQPSVNEVVRSKRTTRKPSKFQ